MHVPANESDIVIPSLPCSDSQPADSPCFLMAGLGTKHRVRFQRFGTKMYMGHSTKNYIFHVPQVSSIILYYLMEISKQFYVLSLNCYQISYNFRKI